ncbi:MAG: FAD-dependent oxidoreductase [Proteobacteria bacterium]|nr:FAD-dependent oxidoreductase [Pseudomonadota bacterium]
MSGVVIIGAGQAGYQVAASLREGGYGDAITLIAEEHVSPYQRPPLSKAYLLGQTTAERLLLRPSSFYVQHAISLLNEVRATSIDREARQVQLSNGSALGYDHLVLAMGARNRRLLVPGGDLDGVMYLRSMVEADALKQRMAEALNIVVVGAGFIGLELAAVASKLGKHVTVIDAAARAMSRAVSPTMSAFFAGAHARWGVALQFNCQLDHVAGEAGRVAGVVLKEGRSLAADLVLVGIGIEPVTDLAAAAGLELDNGIATSPRLLTSDEAISAIGDCASFIDPVGRRVRLESVQNAVDQARCVAARLIGHAEDYAATPWFWSDQRDLKLQMVGTSVGADREVVRGSIADANFSVFSFRSEELIGVESVNRGGDHVFGRRAIASGLRIAAEDVADPNFDLKQYLIKQSLSKLA